MSSIHSKRPRSAIGIVYFIAVLVSIHLLLRKDVIPDLFRFGTNQEIFVSISILVALTLASFSFAFWSSKKGRGFAYPREGTSKWVRYDIVVTVFSFVAFLISTVILWNYHVPFFAHAITFIAFLSGTSMALTRLFLFYRDQNRRLGAKEIRKNH